MMMRTSEADPDSKGRCSHPTCVNIRHTPPSHHLVTERKLCVKNIWKHLARSLCEPCDGVGLGRTISRSWIFARSSRLSFSSVCSLSQRPREADSCSSNKTFVSSRVRLSSRSSWSAHASTHTHAHTHRAASRPRLSAFTVSIFVFEGVRASFAYTKRVGAVC